MSEKRCADCGASEFSEHWPSCSHFKKSELHQEIIKQYKDEIKVLEAERYISEEALRVCNDEALRLQAENKKLKHLLGDCMETISTTKNSVAENKKLRDVLEAAIDLYKARYEGATDVLSIVGTPGLNALRESLEALKGTE